MATYSTAGSSATIGTTSTSVLAANTSRTFLVLCNDSTNTIYVDLSGGTAVASKGVRLNANGGTLVLDRFTPTGAITAIAAQCRCGHRSATLQWRADRR